MTARFLTIRILPILVALALISAGCATRYNVRTEPSDAEITVQNISTGEQFKMGSGFATFQHMASYGNGGFMIMANKKGYATRKLFVPNVPGSTTDYLLTLKPDFTQITETPKDPAELFKQMAEQLRKQQDDLWEKMEQRIAKVQDDLRKQQQENWLALLDKMKKVDDERFAAASDKLRLESQQDAQNTLNKARTQMATLENTFGVYKDALFSDRYSRGPASYDRDRVDEKVAMLNKIQQLVELRRLAEADDLVAKLIVKDEYMPQAYTIKGTIRYLQNKIPEAIASWERALEIDPSQMITRRYLAEAYRKTGKQVPGDLLPIQQDDGTNGGGRAPASAGAGGAKGTKSALPPRVRMRNY